MTPSNKFFHLYLVPLAIVVTLFLALRWIPVQMTLEWLVPLAADYMPASVPPLQIIVFIGLAVGGSFAIAILAMTRYLQRRVIYRQRLRVLEDKRKRGHDNIAASVFDLHTIAIEEDGEAPYHHTSAMCALEEDPRLAVLIGTLWAKPEFNNFLQRLLSVDAGRGTMLSPEMRNELAFLRNLYIDQKRVFLQPARRGEPLPHGASGSDRWRSVACVALLMVLLLVPVP